MKNIRTFTVAFIAAFVIGVALFVSRVPANATQLETGRIIELPKKVWICHKTEEGYNELYISWAGWVNGHKHHETVDPTATVAPTATPTATLTPTSTPEPTGQPTTINNTNNNVVNPGTEKTVETNTVTVPAAAPSTGRG